MTKESKRWNVAPGRWSRAVLVVAWGALGACADPTVAPRSAPEPSLSVSPSGAAPSSASNKVIRVRSKKVRTVPAPFTQGNAIHGAAAAAVIRASLLAAIQAGPKADSAYRVFMHANDGQQQILTASEYLALLDAEQGSDLSRSNAKVSGGFPSVAAVEANNQTVNVLPANSVTPNTSSFSLWSRTGASVTGTANVSLGPVQFTGWDHGGFYSIIVGGATITTGPLSPTGGTLPVGGGWGTPTSWPSIAVGTYCTIDAAMAMDHGVSWFFQNEPLDANTGAPVIHGASRDGVAANRKSRACSDDDELPPPGSPCLDPTLPGCDEGTRRCVLA